MSNLGLELALRNAGVGLVRTQVGDRYVVEKMSRTTTISAVSSRGISCFWITTPPGDGAITCLQMLALMVEKRQRLSELKRVMTRLPQVLLNVDVKERKDFAGDAQASVKRSPRWNGLGGTRAHSWCAIPAPRCSRGSCWKAKTKRRSAPWPRKSPIEIRAEVGHVNDPFGRQRRSRRDCAPGAPRGSSRSGRSRALGREGRRRRHHRTSARGPPAYSRARRRAAARAGRRPSSISKWP